MATAALIDELTTELDRLWERTAVEEAWRGFWRKFKLNGLTAADLYDVKFFLAESFPEHLNSIEVHAEEQYVAVAVDMDDYTLSANVPVVSRKERISTSSKQTNIDMNEHDITPESELSLDFDEARLMVDEAMLDLELRSRPSIAEMEIRFGNPALVFGEGDGDEV